MLFAYSVNFWWSHRADTVTICTVLSLQQLLLNSIDPAALQERSTPSPPFESTSSSQEGHQHSILQQQQQQRSLSPLQDGCGPNNYDYERRMRQLRRRMREAVADWTWLAACMGVVEGDMNPVEAYLNGGGDPTRKLTNPEVSAHSFTYIS